MAHRAPPRSMIRLANGDDAASCAAIYRPIVERTHISYEEVAPDAVLMRERIVATIATHPWLVYEDDGAVLGYAYSYRHRERAGYRWSVDVSIYLGERARGRGIGTALYGALFRILERQRFHRAYAGIALPNDASVALHRAMGFIEVGIYEEVGFKGGVWNDVAWLARPIGATGEIPPPDPIWLADLDPDVLASALQ
jgi:L-amino acid N-acyltransferase YncA